MRGEAREEGSKEAVGEAGLIRELVFLAAMRRSSSGCAGYRKEIDYALERIAEIEKHLTKDDVRAIVNDALNERLRPINHELASIRRDLNRLTANVGWNARRAKSRSLLPARPRDAYGVR